MSCGVVEVVTHSTLRGFEHLERERELTKRIYKSRIHAGNLRGHLPVKWEGKSVGVC